MLHLSPVGLEMGVGSQLVARSAAVKHVSVEVPDGTGVLLEQVIAQPTTTPEPDKTAPEPPSVTYTLKAARDSLSGLIPKREEQEDEEKPVPEVEQITRG